MKKNYTKPTIYIENVVVENGIAASPVYSDPGYAGQEGEVFDYTVEL